MSTHHVKIVRVIEAPLEEVYAAWTVPEIMRHWMGVKIEADVRVGGSYRNEIDAGEGQVFIHRGEYLAIEPEARIIQTFRAGDTDPTDYFDETLEIRFRATGPDETELTFIDQWKGKGMDDESAGETASAWNGWLDGLDALFRK